MSDKKPSIEIWGKEYLSLEQKSSGDIKEIKGSAVNMDDLKQRAAVTGHLFVDHEDTEGSAGR